MKEEATGTEKTAREGMGARVKRLILRFQTVRTIVQFISFLVFFGLFLGIGPWPILLPVIGLLGVPAKTVGDALGALQYMLYLGIAPILALASMFIAGAIVGRAFCAWACPFGFVQDILQVMKRRHTEVSPRTHSDVLQLKYIVLAATLLISGILAASVAAGIKGYQAAFGAFAIAPFNALSPADTLFAVIPKTLLDTRLGLPVALAQPGADIGGIIINGLKTVSALFWARIVILAMTSVLALYIPRGWCRYVCPQGAFGALLMRFSFLGLRRDPVRCNRVGCRDCVEVCPMMVPILDQPWEKFTHPECIMCLKCVDACSTTAIKPKFP